MRFTEYKKLKSVEAVFPLAKLEVIQGDTGKRFITVKDPRSYQTNDGVWHVFPIGESRTQYYIVCPYCGEIHCHGKIEGPRVPHCKNPQCHTCYEISSP